MIRFSKAALAACALMTLPISAAAQDGLFDIPDDEAETYVDLGAAYVSRAAYVGSEETDANIFPYLAGEYEGRLFFNPAIGAGVNAINRDGLQVAAVAWLASGRDAEDTPFVADGAEPTQAEKDAFDLDTSVTVGVLANYLFKYARLDVQAVTPVTGDVEGMRADATLTTLLPLGDVRIFPGVRASWTSDTWTESYYGLTNAQAAATGVPGLAAGFDPDSSWTLGAQAIGFWEVADEVRLVGVLNYSLLQGDAKDSPLSPDNNALTAVVGLAKRF